MDNLVGDNLPTPDKFKNLLKALTQVRQELGKLGVVLSPDQRKRRLRIRKNGLQYVALLMNLVTKYQVETPAAPLADIDNDARLAEELSPFEDEANGISALVQDTLMEAEHELWQPFLMYYGILQRMADNIPTLKAELAPIVEFMAQARRERKKAPNPAPAASPTA